MDFYFVCVYVYYEMFVLDLYRWIFGLRVYIGICFCYDYKYEIIIDVIFIVYLFDFMYLR